MNKLVALLLSAGLSGSLMSGMVAMQTGRGLVVAKEKVATTVPPKPIVKTVKRVKVITVTKKQPASAGAVMVVTVLKGSTSGSESTNAKGDREAYKEEEKKAREEERKAREEERKAREEQKKLEEQQKKLEEQQKEEQKKLEEQRK